MVLATVLPLREFDTQLALDILSYHQQRNHAAYLSHRKRRIALVVLGRNNPSPYTVNGRPLYVHLNGLAIVLLK